MKVVFLMQDTGVVYGAERATLELARGLATAGVEVSFLLIEESRLRGRKSDLQETLRQKNLSFSGIETGSRFSWELVRAIRAALQERKADVLHTVGYKADLHGGLASRWGRLCSAVSTVHGWLYRADPKERFYEWLERLALKRFNRVIVLSAFYRDRLLAAGFRPERVAHIPSGLDIAGLPGRAPAPADSVFTVGMLGRLSTEKNHLLFLRAAKAVLDRGIRAQFIIAGEGPERQRIESAISSLGIGQAVSVPGYLPTAEFMKQVHVLVQCSFIENLPYSIMEAMAWSRPVIATRAGGMPELVADGETGFLVAPHDAPGLADRIAALAADRPLACRMGGAGRDRLERDFTIERQVTAYAAVVGSLRAGAGS